MTMPVVFCQKQDRVLLTCVKPICTCTVHTYLLGLSKSLHLVSTLMHLHCIQFRQIHSYLLVRQVRAAASDFHLRHVLHSGVGGWFIITT